MSNLEIESFINLFESSDLDSTELLDILWLAKYMKTDKKYYKLNETTNESFENDNIDEKSQEKPEHLKSNDSKTDIEVMNNSFPLSINNKSQETNKTVNISHKGYFEDSNQISNYLINFKDKSLSKRKKLFNEIETINYKANTGIFNPFFEAKKQKRYTLYLFIDYSETMNIWKEMIIEYTKLLSIGIFKSIRYVYINSDNDKTLFYKDKKLNKQFNPREITNFHKDKLIFVLTDMLSSCWINGDTLNIIDQLYKSIPMYIIQMLPYRLWRTTALKKASITTFNAVKSYTLGSSYLSDIDYLIKSSDEDCKKNLQLPIVSFDLSYLKVIGNTLKANCNNKIDGAIFNIENIKNNESITESKTMSGQEKVEHFFANASPMAQELAKCLSPIQFNLAIMRMIQEKVLNESNNIYIAEVINSGLVKSYKNVLEFEEDVSDVLYKLLGRERALEIFYKNSDYIQENLGLNFGFKAYLSGKVNLEDSNTSENDKRFATISYRILKSMGGEYSKFADKMSKMVKKNISLTSIDSKEIEFDSHSFVLRNEIFNKIWDILGKGANVFLHGMAGTGKTTILKYIEKYPRNKYFIKYLNFNSYTNIGQLKNFLNNVKENKILFLIDDFSETDLNTAIKIDFYNVLIDFYKGKSVQFIFSGRNLFEIKIRLVGNLVPISVQGFTKKEIYDFIIKMEHLIKIKLDAEIREYIFDNFSSPLLVTMIMKILSSTSISEKITKKTFIKITSEYFDNSIKNIIKIFSAYQKNMAIFILNYISIRETFNLQENTPFREDYKLFLEVIDKLEENPFIFKKDNNIEFAHKSIKFFWKNNIEDIGSFINLLVKQDLGNYGWNSNNIIDSKISNDEFSDILLADNNQKLLGLIVIKPQIVDIKDFTSEVISYALELQVNVGYITDGNEIYKCDFDNNILQRVDRYIYPSEVKLLIETKLVKEEGIIKFINQEKGFGVIINQTSDDIFFHISGVRDLEFADLKEGDNISFTLVEGDRGLKAIDITLVNNIENEIKEGVITSIKKEAGVGFISNDEIGDEIFFHANNLEGVEFDDLTVGEYLSFEMGEGRDGKTQAVNITLSNNEKEDITFDCEECETGYSFDCKELHWEQVGGSERKMGTEIEYEAEYYKTCHTCSNEMSITFSCWEFPVGAENHRDIASHGIINLEGSCCLEFNSSEEEYSDYDYHESIEDEGSFYSDLEEKMEVLEEFINNLLPYSELEYMNDSDSYSNKENVRSDQFLISYEFDNKYLYELIDEIQDDLNEVKFALDGNTSNIINDNSLLVRKRYMIEYDGIYEAYGVDKDCNVYINDVEQILYIYPKEEKRISVTEMKDWFFDHYDDPANLLPYIGREGGYQYLFGGPYELEQVLFENFSQEYSDEYIQNTIDIIENEYGNMSWEKKPDENKFIESNKINYSQNKEQDINDNSYIKNLIGNNTNLQIEGDFEGWSGESVIVLTNGDIWKQSEYYYEYVYSYMPKVSLSTSYSGYKMKVDGISKEVSVEKLNNVIKSKVKGAFNGWDGSTIIELLNGEKWKQSSYSYSYSYSYQPDVIIYQSDFGYKMKVDGNDKTVDVERII